MVTATLKISLRTTHTANNSRPPDFASLARSEELQDKYSIEISNRYTQLLYIKKSRETETDMQQDYDKLIEILRVEAAYKQYYTTEKEKADGESMGKSRQ